MILKHTTLVTARFAFFCFVAAKIWRHAGRVGISYSDQYPERGLFPATDGSLAQHRFRVRGEFQPVLASAFTLCKLCIAFYAQASERNEIQTTGSDS